MAGEREAIYRLREVMARELDTINQYEQFADATADPEIKALFQHLADEEKEHVQEVFEILLQHDPAQAAWGQGAHVAAIREGRFSAAIAAGESPKPTAPAPPAATDQPVSAPPTAAPIPWKTVGSLYGQAQS